MGVLHLARQVYESMRAHAEETYPDECCGVLLGTSAQGEWTILSATRTANASVHAARTSYSIDPVELVHIHRDATRQGMEIGGFYHSHPDHPAHWSPTDLAEAHWVGCCYVITEVRGGKAGQTSSFLLAGTREEDKRFEPQELNMTAS